MGFLSSIHPAYTSSASNWVQLRSRPPLEAPLSIPPGSPDGRVGPIADRCALIVTDNTYLSIAESDLIYSATNDNNRILARLVRLQAARFPRTPYPEDRVSENRCFRPCARATPVLLPGGHGRRGVQTLREGALSAAGSETSRKPSHCFHMTEVAGSNPASPTSGKLRLQVKRQTRSKRSVAQLPSTLPTPGRWLGLTEI
jgi:hypothetical protein